MGAIFVSESLEISLLTIGSTAADKSVITAEASLDGVVDVVVGFVCMCSASCGVVELTTEEEEVASLVPSPSSIGSVGLVVLKTGSASPDLVCSVVLECETVSSIVALVVTLSFSSRMTFESAILTLEMVVVGNAALSADISASLVRSISGDSLGGRVSDTDAEVVISFSELLVSMVVVEKIVFSVDASIVDEIRLGVFDSVDA